MLKQDNGEYVRISQHQWVRKDNFDYFTEKELIKRVAEKYGIDEREVKDLYTRFMTYMLNQLKSPEKDYDKGYYLTNFGYFQKKNLIITDLFMQRDSIKYRKAKQLLDSYVMKGQSRIHPK